MPPGRAGVCDVLGDPNHTDRLTGVVDHHLGSVAQRPQSSVGADRAVLERERRAPHRLLDGVDYALSISG